MSKSFESIYPSFASYQGIAWFSSFNDVRIYKLWFNQSCMYILIINCIFRHNTHHYLQFFSIIRDSIKNGTFDQFQKKIRLKFAATNSESTTV